MRSSNCPVCGEKHNSGNPCIWDNLIVDSSIIDYYSKRQKAYQNLLEDISKIQELKAAIDVKRHENERWSFELGMLERQITDAERQIESKGRSTNLVTQENEFMELKISLNGLIQESTRLKKEIKDVSDYDELKSYLQRCLILISIHKS